MRKSILFFHRAQLTDFYLLLSKYLLDEFNIIHVAYSERELQVLQSNGIEDVICMTNEVEKLLNTTSLDYKIVNQIDTLFIKNTNGEFNLNASIQSDRGFSFLNYDESLLLSQVYYLFWSKLFQTNTISYVFHEPPALLLIHLLTVLCKQYSASFIWHRMSQGEDGKLYYCSTDSDFICNELLVRLQFYREFPDSINIKRCKEFVDDFRKDQSIYLGTNISNRMSTAHLFMMSLKHNIKSIYKTNPYSRLSNNISYWLFEQDIISEKLKNIREYKQRNIVFEDIPDHDEVYYYYPLHLEPEAVVLYFGGGIYTNQIKLIENIAASLPVGTYLYVKDHPHEYAYRHADDYKRLMKVPNIRLLKSGIPGKRVIRRAKGVFTINGTAGFEALLMGKQVYCFGHSYYSSCKRVKYVHNIRELRGVVYDNYNIVYEDDEELYAYVNAYLDSLHFGLTDYFNHRASKYGVDLEENAKQIAQDFKKYSQKF